jgi:hypothetical protein
MAIQSSVSNQVLTTSGTPAFVSVAPGNLLLSGNAFNSTNTNGNINIIPNGTGTVTAGSSTLFTGTGSGFFTLEVAKSGAQTFVSVGSFKNNASPSVLGMYKSRSTTVGSHTTVNSGDTIGATQYNADDGTNYVTASQIDAVVASAPSTGIIPTDLRFYTCNTSGTLTLGMSLSSSQALSVASNITSSTGVVSSGTAAGGVVGQFRAFSTTAALGSLSLTVANSAGDYANVLTNASTSASRTWTLPDASGTIALASGASGIVNSGTQNQLAWYAATGTTVSGLATANNGILVTSSGGVPSISSTLPSAVQANITGLGIINQNLTLSPNAGSVRYIVLNTDNTYTGQFNLQAGGGSPSYGGGLVMYGASHATRPGWVTAALSSGGSNFFTVNTNGTGGGTDVFTVSSVGNVVANGSITVSQTAGVIGTTTNNDAAAGSVGEVISAVNAGGGSAINLTTATAAAVTSISLTAGDWDVYGSVVYSNGATTNLVSARGFISTAVSLISAEFSAIVDYGTAGLVLNGTIGLTCPPRRVSISSTTTIYLVAYANFTIDVCTAYGQIYARRRR